MRFKMKYVYLFFTIFFIIFAAILSLWLYFNQAGVELILFSISIVSLTISIMAFFISLNTFISIDSVNKVAKMEGNLLENEKYVLSLPDLLDTYSSKTARGMEEQLFKDLRERFEKKSKTSIEFTDHLQHFIDVLVFLPALFQSEGIDKKEYNEHKEQILRSMTYRQKDLKSIVNTGDFIQVEETIKLIKGVIGYQSFAESMKDNPDVLLLRVRGSVLTNGVTKTVYYNYLGLYYNKKAIAIIQRALNLQGKNLLIIENARLVYQALSKIGDRDRELVQIFLQESLKALDKASESCQQDTMWLGFIQYNMARSIFFKEALEGLKEDTWLEVMNQAVGTRSKLNIIIEEVLKGEKTHLRNHFIYQEKLARVVRINLLVATDKLLPVKAKEALEQELKGNEKLYNEYKVLKEYNMGIDS